MRKKVFLSIMLCMTLGLATGCSVQKNDSEESTEVTEESHTSAPASEVQVDWDAEVGSEFDTFNPIQTTTQAGRSIAANCFEGLMKLDESGGLTAGQAESYQVSKDGLTYTFTLREDALWSDGEKVSAQEFVAAWRELIQSTQASKLSMVENASQIIEGNAEADTLGVEATDEHTFVVKLAYADPFFLQTCADPATAPLRESAELGETWSKSAYVCNGAYKVAKASGNQVTLEKNSSYYDKDKVTEETINLLWGDAESADKLEQGTFFFAESVEGADTESTLWERYSSVTQELVGIFVEDMSKKGETDASNAVRSAMGAAIDREYLHEKQGEGWKISHSFLPKEIMDEDEDRDTFDSGNYETDVSQGVQALTDAKVTGTKVQIKWYEDGVHTQMAELISDMWEEELGFELLDSAQSFSKNVDFQGIAFLTQRTVDSATLGEAVPTVESQTAFYIPKVDASDIFSVNQIMHEAAVLVPVFQTVNWYGVSEQVQHVYTLNGCHYFMYVCAK